MSGFVALTVRMPNGTVERMCRGSGTLAQLHNLQFFEEPETFLNQFMQPWFHMKADWDAHGPSGPFADDRTEIYGNPDNRVCAPIEYGLVVIDCQTYIILDSQVAFDLAHYTLAEAYAFKPRAARYDALNAAGRLHDW